MSASVAIGAGARAVMSLPIASIGELPADQYVGLIDDSAVACLSARLAAEGLLTPIWVRRNGNAAKVDWSVIAGRHRLLAAKALGWSEIAVEERAGPASGTDELRRLQIAENLDRRTLRPIELACHVMERWRATASTITPSVPHNAQSAAVRERWASWEAISNAPVGDRREIDDTVAAECGRSDKWVRTYRRLYETIVVGLPNAFARLNAHPLGESLSTMTKLAALNDGARLKAANLLLTRDDWVSIDQVLIAAGLAHTKGDRPTADEHDRQLAFHWGRMTGSQRRSFAPLLAKTITPPMAREIVELFRAEGLL